MRRSGVTQAGVILRRAERVSRQSAAACRCYTCSSPLRRGGEKQTSSVIAPARHRRVPWGETQSRHIIWQSDSLAGALGCPLKPEVTLRPLIVRRARVCECVQELHGRSCEPLLERPSTRCGFPADGLNHRGNRAGGVETNSAGTCRMSVG